MQERTSAHNVATVKIVDAILLFPVIIMILLAHGQFLSFLLLGVVSYVCVSPQAFEYHLFATHATRHHIDEIEFGGSMSACVPNLLVKATPRSACARLDSR